MNIDDGRTVEELAAAFQAAEAEEITQTEIDSDSVSPDANPRSWRQTNEGMARILVERHINDLRFVYDLAKSVKDSEYFATWNGQRWETSSLAVIQLAQWMRDMTAELREEAAKVLAEALKVPFIEAGELEPKFGRFKKQLDDFQKRFIGFSSNAESTTFKSAWQQQIKTHQAIQIKFTEFDQDPWLLNCQNGTLNLETGELLPFRREDYITKQIDVAYDPEATCPEWDKFLNRIFQKKVDGKLVPDPDLIGYLQQAVGYSLTGQTSEECFFICWGTGGNGKSKFLGAISDLLGPYAAAPSIETFLDAKRNSQGASEDIASLRGARLAVATEPDDGARLAAGLLKRMSGRDEMSARFLFQNSFKFKPTHKLWLLVNEEPQLNGSDGGIKRRLRKIPFTAQLADTEIDKALDIKLRKELPGILNWAIAGVKAWKACEKGLVSPEVIQAASDSYFTDQDSVQAFITDRCVVGGEEYHCRPSDIYAAYSRYCEQMHIKAQTKQAFGRDLTKKKFVLSEDSRTRYGLQLDRTQQPSYQRDEE